MSPAPKRGEVWLARIDKVRPFVVLTRDPMGRLLNSVIGVPITSTIRGLSTEVLVGPEDGVLNESVASLDNTQLITRSRFIRRVGRVTPSKMSAICEALEVAVGCER